MPTPAEVRALLSPRPSLSRGVGASAATGPGGVTASGHAHKLVACRFDGNLAKA
ncbi:hypothetical protein GGTG_08931 [Gaeumannomyces tritici R3-111a-1]|uniref:Uncharacterized protein n=1 Tax=Gaeumannomyces tritici (strain R3-111a-1) TaxID=644352 RepID=J3P5Z1_GAET3|nr:hypothetical protein GGTG_08931 [Gaeumannomyces tritici R3-111a-1]EJT75093.1 hypothetical protein GGTG_08931 [Gaeumannomyces tritici R3-111a-1]